MTANVDAASTVGIISLVGFAIQRALQVADPCVDLVIEIIQSRDAAWKVAPADLKRSVMALVAFLLGLLITNLAGLRFLAATGIAGHELGDILVTALVLSAGAEGANSITKVLETIKTTRQEAATPVEVRLAVSQLSLKVGGTAQLQATVLNSANPGVTWRAVEGGMNVGSGGDITALSTAGVFHVIATSIADPVKFATAIITVN